SATPATEAVEAGTISIPLAGYDPEDGPAGRTPGRPVGGPAPTPPHRTPGGFAPCDASCTSSS
ncbi:hypothetical protein ACWDO3_33835, partial [Streptomyces hydrogenans]